MVATTIIDGRKAEVPIAAFGSMQASRPDPVPPVVSTVRLPTILGPLP
jgi:hypothetical protein